MQKRITVLILIFAIVLTMGGEVILSALTVHASEEKQYSNVLDDLQKDSTFDTAMYPDDPEDISVKLIQIAESEDGQLFLYVYQPSNDTIDLKCTSVSISVGFSSNGQGLDPKFYDLILVSTEGVFDKYLVNGFVLPDEAERYYNIVQILREFNAAVDPESDKTEYKDTVCKSYTVGQQWCAHTVNNSLVYEMNTFNTVELEIKMSSTIKVNGGVQFAGIFGLDKDVESHFVVFDCEQYQIKYVYNATVFCRSRKYEQNGYFWGAWEGDREYPDGEAFSEEYIKLSDKESPVIVEAPGLCAKEYSFDRIMTVAEFKENLQENGVSYDEEAVAQLSDNQWVFSYLETDLTLSDSGVAGGMPGVLYTHYGTEVEGYILQIAFMDMNENVYDLGVVSDGFNSTGSLGEGGGADWDELTDMLGIILGLFGLCAIFFMLSFISPIIKDFINAIWDGIKFGFNVSIAIITWPFRFLWGLLSGK